MTRAPISNLVVGAMAVICLFANSSYGQERWQSDWGMGITTAWVDLGPGNRISVTCTGGYGRPVAGVEFTLDGRNAPANTLVVVSVDQRAPLDVPVDDNGTLKSNSRVEAQWFEALVSAFKDGQSTFVRFNDGIGARFSLVGSAEAIGECPADFWRPDLDREP